MEEGGSIAKSALRIIRTRIKEERGAGRIKSKE